MPDTSTPLSASPARFYDRYIVQSRHSMAAASLFIHGANDSVKKEIKLTWCDFPPDRNRGTAYDLAIGWIFLDGQLLEHQSNNQLGV